MTPDSSLQARLEALRRGSVPDEELYDLLHTFGEAELTEAEPEVVLYLGSANPSLRYMALSILTFHWQLRKYEAECRRFLVEGPSPRVRAVAAAGLGALLKGSREPQATAALLQGIRNGDEDPLVRVSAYDALIDLWAPSRSRETLRKELDEEEESIRRVDRIIEVSRQLEEAGSQGDEESAEKLSTELAGRSAVEERRWDKMIDWDFVAAIERGGVSS